MHEKETLPLSVQAVLKKHPECSLHQTESSVFSHSSEATTAHQVTERQYYLQCPSKPPYLIHSESSKRSIPSSDIYAGSGGVFPDSILGGSYGQQSGNVTMEELLRDLLSGRPPMLTNRREGLGRLPSHPATEQTPRPPLPGSGASIAV